MLMIVDFEEMDSRSRHSQAGSPVDVGQQYLRGPTAHVVVGVRSATRVGLHEEPKRGFSGGAFLVQTHQFVEAVLRCSGHVAVGAEVRRDVPADDRGAHNGLVVLDRQAVEVMGADHSHKVEVHEPLDGSRVRGGQREADPRWAGAEAKKG